MAFPADHAGDPFRHTSPTPPQHATITMEDELSLGEGEVEGSDRGAWFIPRPALCRNSTTCTSCHSSATDRQASRSIRTVTEWLSPPSTSSTPSSSKSSTQSGTSGTLLLTAANLAALRLEHTHGIPDQGAHKALDTASVASSMHFTMVNGVFRKRRGPPPVDCCRTCHKHQLTAVVLTVCGLFLVGLGLAVYYIDMRARGATLS